MSVKTSILFGLGIIDALMREFRDPGGFVSFSYENLYGFVPKNYKRKNLYSLTDVLKKSKDITSSQRGIFALTKHGQREIYNTFPLLQYLHKPWDGKWRIVGFDVEEEKRILRDKLRRFLVRYGFGMLQKSLYVSALPVEEDLEKFLSSNRNIFGNTYIFVSERFFLEDREAFIDRIFATSSINHKYKTILEKAKGDLGEEETRQVLREFLGVSRIDPFLPKELLPKDFAREAVWKILGEKGIFSL